MRRRTCGGSEGEDLHVHAPIGIPPARGQRCKLDTTRYAVREGACVGMSCLLPCILLRIFLISVAHRMVQSSPFQSRCFVSSSVESFSFSSVPNSPSLLASAP
eukprot:3223927-Pyramimonas_sp.AAC.1